MNPFLSKTFSCILVSSIALLAFASTALAAPSRSQVTLPARGLLVGGVSLAGVKLGDSPAAVEQAWGTSHTTCDGCRQRTWLFIYPDQPVGAAVTFDTVGRAVAVFTLGQPTGWRTKKGLSVGQDVHLIALKHDTRSMSFSECIGYAALSARNGGVVTSIFTHGEFVYGFALTRPGKPVCQ